MPELVLTARKQAKPGQPIPNLYAIFLCSVQVMVMVLKLKISPENCFVLLGVLYLKAVGMEFVKVWKQRWVSSDQRG